MSFARNQSRFIHHLKSNHPLLSTRKMVKYNFNGIDDPVNIYIYVSDRVVGRSQQRWDNFAIHFGRKNMDDIGSISWILTIYYP